jgi:hypothetical protein
LTATLPFCFLQQQQQQQQVVTVESLLSGILHFRVQHHMQQLALVPSLELLLQQHPQVSYDMRIAGARMCSWHSSIHN